MTKHLLLPGVDTVEEEALQIHQDVVTYMQKQHGKCSPGYLISCVGDTASFGCELLHVRVRGLIELILIVVCIVTYGDEERMERCGFRWRLVAAQRHSECLAAVCRERRRKLLCAQVEKEKRKKNREHKNTPYTPLWTKTTVYISSGLPWRGWL